MDFKTYWAKNVEADVFGVSKNVSKYFEVLMLKDKENLDEQALQEANDNFRLGNEMLINRLRTEGILKLINENVDIAEKNVTETQIQIATELYNRFNAMRNRGSFRFSEQYKALRSEESDKIELLCSPHTEKEIVYSAKDDEYIVKVDGDVLVSKKREDINSLGRTLERDIFSKSLSSYQDIDKKLVCFIYEVFGKKAVTKYIRQWEKGFWGDKKQLPFTIRYDFSILGSEMEKEKNVIMNKNRLDKIIKRNKKLSVVDEKTAGLNGRNRKGSIKKKDNFFKRTVAVIKEILGINDNSREMLGNGRRNNVKMISEKSNIYELNEFKRDEANSERAYVTKIETISRRSFNNTGSRNEINNELIRTWLEKGREQRNQEIAATAIENVAEAQQKQGLCIGNIIKINEPIAYSADSRDKEKNFRIGTFEWRPFGEYEINGVSVINKDNQIINYSMNNKELDVKEFVKSNMQDGGRVNYHISYVMGRDKQPTGWVADTDIYKLMDL